MVDMQNKTEDEHAYLIVGQSGTHDGFSMWYVAVFLENEDAKVRLKKLKSILKENKIPMDVTELIGPNENYSCVFRDLKEDPNLWKYISYFGVEYSIEKVKLENGDK